eukprot:6467759-Amphidinium_carterae.1
MGTIRPPMPTGETLSSEEHSTYPTIVGKLLWMCPLRPDIQYATKELTRAVQKPDQHDKQNAKHLLNTYKAHKTTNYICDQNNQHTPSLTSKHSVTATGQDAAQQENRQVDDNNELPLLQVPKHNKP